jgi:hypothetical protein
MLSETFMGLPRGPPDEDDPESSVKYFFSSSHEQISDEKHYPAESRTFSADRVMVVSVGRRSAMLQVQLASGRKSERIETDRRREISEIQFSRL